MHLLTVGEAFDDLIFAGMPRLPRAGEELRVPHFVRTMGGGALITAVAAARLGLPTTVITATSRDAVQRLADDKVSVINLKREQEPTALSVALSTKTNRSFVTFEGVNRVLQRRLTADLKVRHYRCQHVHFALSPSSCRAWLPVIARFQMQRVTTSWDFGWNEGLLRDRSFAALLNAVDYLFMNEQEDKLYARALRRRTRPTIVKRGARGATLRADGAALRTPAVRARSIDTTGAGDAFNGGFLATLLRGHDMADAMRMGNFVAGRSTEALGGIDGLPIAVDLPRWGHPLVTPA